MKKLLSALLFLFYANSAWALSQHTTAITQADQINALTHLTIAQKNQFAQLNKNIATTEKTLGAYHPIIAKLLEDMGMLYQESGLYDEARQKFVQAMKISEARNPENHPNSIILLNRIARSFFLQGEYDTANRFYMLAFKRMSGAIGAQHIESARFLENLARVYYKESLYQQAEPFIVNAIKLYKKYHSSSNTQVLALLKELEDVYSRTGKKVLVSKVRQEIALIQN